MDGAKTKKRLVLYKQRVKRIVISPSDYESKADQQKKPPPLGSVLVDIQHTSSDEEDEVTKTDTSIWLEI